MLERRFLPLFLTSFVLSAGYGSIYALLAAIRETFGFSPSAIGLIGGAGFLAGFCAQVGLARFADRGRTREMLRLGLLCAMTGNVGMVFADELWSFVAARALLGLGAGAFAPAVRRLLIARDPERAGERLGLMASFDMAGFISGPVIASVLHQALGLQVTFGVLAFGLLALAPAVLRTRVPSVPPSSETRPIRALLSRAAVRGALLCSLAFYTTVGVFEAIWAVLLADLGASQLFIGATLSVFSLPMLFIPPFAGGLAQSRGPLRIVAGGVLVAIPCMAVYGLVESLWVLAAVVALHSVADAFTMPSLQLGIAQASPPEHLASGQGLIGAAGQLMAALTALGSGWLYGSYGAASLFGGAAALMAILLAAGLSQGRTLLAPPAPAPTTS